MVSQFVCVRAIIGYQELLSSCADVLVNGPRICANATVFIIDSFLHVSFLTINPRVCGCMTSTHTHAKKLDYVEYCSQCVVLCECGCSKNPFPTPLAVSNYQTCRITDTDGHPPFFLWVCGRVVGCKKGTFNPEMIICVKPTFSGCVLLMLSIAWLFIVSQSSTLYSKLICGLFLDI
jgi:hypothetical protein